jgi:hypothetical protein
MNIKLKGHTDLNGLITLYKIGYKFFIVKKSEKDEFERCSRSKLTEDIALYDFMIIKINMNLDLGNIYHPIISKITYTLKELYSRQEIEVDDNFFHQIEGVLIP